MAMAAYPVSWNGRIDADCDRALQRRPEPKRWNASSKWASRADAVRAVLREAGPAGLTAAMVAARCKLSNPMVNAALWNLCAAGEVGCWLKTQRGRAARQTPQVFVWAGDGGDVRTEGRND